MLSLFIHKQLAEVKIFKFPAGESGVSFSVKDPIPIHCKVNAMITLRWEGNDDLINLALLVDAVRRQYDVHLALEIPYFPYARQDRVCNIGESLSVKVIADFINSLNFHTVYVRDPHSDVLGAVLNNMFKYDVLSKVERSFVAILSGDAPCLRHTYLVSPDAGANKKVIGYAKTLGTKVIKADKERDVQTGAITGTTVYSEHLGDTNLLVVDDILDGGGTFIPLAKALRSITNGSVSLYVTHGLFTKGVDIFEGVYDNIFVANNMYGKHKLIQEV
jgi:ribose-phosphate pyrophosphokinase